MSDLVEINERIGGYLKWSSMADNASFGLEYLLQGKKDGQTLDLLKEGIKLCEMLEKGITDATPIDDANLEAYSAISSLITPFDETSEIDEMDIKTIAVEAKINKASLQTAIRSEIYLEEDIRKLQRFFNKVSSPYLKRAFRAMHKIETFKGMSTNVQSSRNIIS